MNSENKSKFSSQRMEVDDEDDEVGDLINDLKSIPLSNNQSKFSIPKYNSGSSSNPTTSKSKLRSFEPIDPTPYFPNQTMINGEIPVYWNGNSGPNLVCLHGAGHSAFSFAPLAKLINEKYRLISFDFRGHGSNTMSEGEDLSQETLVADTIKVLEFIAQEFPNEVIIVVGHSMGGSIATKATAEIFKNDKLYPDLNEKIMGLIIIDVVEGTAMEALPFMENIVETRPNFFPTLDKGIEYMYKSNTIKNIESARISVPSLLKEVLNKKGEKVFTWKTNLMSSQKYWTDWFLGLTKCFLSIKIPKILLLAGSDRMDKDLTIAQMQGKFKLSVLNDVGHIIQEDDPKGVANLINNFITTFKIPANVSEFKPIIGKLGNPSAKSSKYDESNYIMK